MQGHSVALKAIIAGAFLLCATLPLSIYAKSISRNTAPDFKASIHTIPLAVQKKMRQYSWHPGCPVPLNGLAYVKLTYWGYDKQPHQGALIVNRSLARETVQIFKKLYDHRFPIQLVQPMYLFKGNITASLESNSTLSFTCRPITGYQKGFSRHSYGKAIDINAHVNPYQKGNSVLPPSGRVYLDRRNMKKGMITKGDVVYRAFAKRGWHWGGNWDFPKDYMHFEKPQV